MENQWELQIREWVESAIELCVLISYVNSFKFGKFSQNIHFAGNRIISDINILLQCEGKIEIVYAILVINSQVDVSCYRPDFIPKIYEFLGLCNFFYK